MKILNFTPHEINIGGSVIPSSGTARVSETITTIGDVNGIPIIKKELGEVVGLPEPEEDTVYIVSLMVAQALRTRTDLLSPGELLRDEKGRVTGCSSLCTQAERIAAPKGEIVDKYKIEDISENVWIVKEDGEYRIYEGEKCLASRPDEDSAVRCLYQRYTGRQIYTCRQMRDEI